MVDLVDFYGINIGKYMGALQPPPSFLSRTTAVAEGPDLYVGYVPTLFCTFGSAESMTNDLQFQNAHAFLGSVSPKMVP